MHCQALSASFRCTAVGRAPLSTVPSRTSFGAQRVPRVGPSKQRTRPTFHVQAQKGEENPLLSESGSPKPVALVLILVFLLAAGFIGGSLFVPKTTESQSSGQAGVQANPQNSSRPLK